jgi:hypothetical protein
MTDPVENEKTRISNEKLRIKNELDDEAGRVPAEELRVGAEADRVVAEDARVVAGFTRTKAARVFVVAVMIFVVIVGIAGWILVDNTTKIHDLAKSNTDLIQQLRDQQTAGRLARIAALNDTNERVRQLACIIVSQANPSDPKNSDAQRKLINQFRKEYQCPPFSKTRNPFAPLPHVTSSPAPTGSSQTQGSGTPGGNGSTGSAKTGSNVSPSATRTPASTPTSHTTQQSASKPSGFKIPCIISREVCVGTVCLCV